MKVNPNTKKYYHTTFTSYNKIDKNTGFSTSSSFYHDFPVLQKATKIIEKEFPDGTDIFIYAGSNGEEALSVNTLLNKHTKYKIYSLDISKEAVDFANNKIFAIHPLAEDGFLLNQNNYGYKKVLSTIFHKNFTEIKKPQTSIDNVTDFIYTITFGDVNLYPQRYFVPNKPFIKNINFLIGDINDIDMLNKKESAGAIFFRNAVYQITKNDLTGVLQYGDSPNIEINRKRIIQELIKKVYNTLKINGIFVLGNHLQEHLYIADKSIPLNETIPVHEARNLRFMKKHPLIEILTMNGKFKPLYESVIQGLSKNNSLKIPLIWQKIK